MDRPSHKLADQAVGRFRILEKVGNAFRVELPPEIKVHLVFSPDKLRKASRTELLRRQIPDPPPTDEVSGEQEWEVDEILDSRLYYRKQQYRARWAGVEDNSWYPALDYKNAPLKLLDYHNRYPDRPGPPCRLQDWITAAAKDEFVEDHLDDNRPAQGTEPKLTWR